MLISFVDVETGGLDDNKHALLEVAVARVDAKTGDPVDLFSRRVLPCPGLVIENEAAAINGYDQPLWSATGETEETVLPYVHSLLKGTVFAGHNPVFDRGFLWAGFSRVGLEPPKPSDYHLLDTASLAWPLVASGLIEKPKLALVCQAVGVDVPGHRALEDALAAAECYRRLVSVFAPSALAAFPQIASKHT